MAPPCPMLRNSAMNREAPQSLLQIAANWFVGPMGWGTHCIYTRPRCPHLFGRPLLQGPERTWGCS